MKRSKAVEIVLNITDRDRMRDIPEYIVQCLIKEDVSEEQFKRLFGICRFNWSTTKRRLKESVEGTLSIEEMILALEARARKGC